MEQHKQRISLRFNEKAPVKGELRLRIYRKGRLMEVWEDENLVVDAGRSVMAKLIGGQAGLNVNRVAFGTNATDPAPGDTAIQNAFIKPISAVSYPTATQVRFDFTLLESEANGLSIREFGLLCANGTLFARRTRGGKTIDKDSDLAIEGQWTIFF
ncbi:hypothetical protein [Desulfofundulus thermosubterraneus]|uniref:Uncharacterized protein n=1 Tax=Desulfofundulus thermosubterraneus DSM 16057 TaxID=1121432 RepID=A0A1M6M9T1_9FIRM|nr:hypothetical protein [Desulfofundulus thermosubterraneus]SHJ80225.1 hypothetical protein SAMN02745219_03375 [Desulfofundulus thermosubterraneus DSM 16057]